MASLHAVCVLNMFGGTPGPQCVGVALLAGRDDTVAMLLREEGCDVDALCIKNKTALHLACQVSFRSPPFSTLTHHPWLDYRAGASL